jgi:L-threonylcarbamoyladenylate synthase
MGACINKEQKEFLLKYWPGALTAIIEKPGSKEICAHKYKTLGVRIPAHRGLQELLSAYSGKMLTTSANRSGSPSLADADMLFKEFQNEVDWLIEDDMSCDGTASTVIDLTCEPFKILRQGKIIPDIC